MGVLSENLFTMIVAVAFVTTVAMPPTLRWALRLLPVEESEQKRLDREVVNAKTFLAGLERLLVVVDNSRNGSLALRITGLLAGMRGIPIILLRASEAGPTQADEESPATEVIIGAAANIPREENEQLVSLDVIERRHDMPVEQAVAAEAENGYDLLIVGVRPVVSPKGGFDSHVSRIARAFPGALAIVSARGAGEAGENTPTILVPVTGSEVSQRGAELAIVLAKAASSTVAALSVIPPEARMERRRHSTRRREAKQTAKEPRAIAEAYEQSIKTSQRTDISAEDAILREARRSAYNLMGVSRTGRTAILGDLATALLESSDRSLLFLDPSSRPHIATVPNQS